MNDRENCKFCKIVNKELSSTIIFENEEVLAFLPLVPAAKGHTLLVPKKHSDGIYDIDTSLFVRLSGVAQALVKEITKTNGATGINILHASGKDAQQSLFHFHLHLVPRYPDDGLDLWFRNNL